MATYITLEEHFISSHVTAPSVFKQPGMKYDQLVDFDDRIASLRKNKIRTQVLSHVPPYGRDWTTAECQAINSNLAETVAASGKQLAAFATLPMHDPAAAVLELERCVRDFGFVGSLVDNNLSDNTFYDGLRFRSVFEAHEKLDVPIYLHPTFPSDDVFKKLYAGDAMGDTASLLLSISGFGWHSMTGLHIMRLFAAGVFDQFPRLKVVLGHNGEFLPYNLARTGRVPLALWGADRVKTLQQVWDENIWVTTSGSFSLDPLACLLRNTRADKIMFSVDYPFSTNEQGIEFMETLKASGMVTAEQWEMMAWGNAKKLLRLED